MSQAQATTETSAKDQAAALTKEQTSSLKTLTTIGYLEGTSFLLLLAVAMPLKYMMGIPEGVKYIGMAHGFLFIGYIVILMGTANKVKMPLWAMPAGVVASILPMGPFAFDYLLKKSLKNS